jgi:drug/metabolite transporter (DMT)-like permease
MHTAIFLWGFTGLLGKLIQLNEGMLVWYRLLISSIAIALLLASGNGFPRLSRKDLWKISGVGILVMFHWVTFYASIKLASISIAMICLSTIALFASIIEPLVNRQRFDYLEIVFSALAVIGISQIYFSDVTASTGIIVGVISAFISAVFSVFNKRLTARHEPLTISLVELTSGFIFLTLLLPVYFTIQPTTKYVPDLSDTIYLLILSLVCTVFTWILSLQALRKVSAFTMGLALNLEPIYGIILAVLFAGEGKLINFDFILGSLTIMVTVVLHTIYKFARHYRNEKKFRATNDIPLP